MANDPLVSIVIPVYNRQKFIGRAIESALNQSYPHVEVIVCDNCSSDGTFDAAQAYQQRDQRLRCFRNDTNLGPVPNWRRGIELAQGKYVKLLFSDEWLDAKAIEHHLVPMEGYEDVSFSFGAARFHGRDGSSQVRLLSPTPLMIDRWEYLWAQAIGRNRMAFFPSSALYRRNEMLASLLVNIPNQFDLPCNRLGSGNDTLMNYYCAALRPKIAFVPHPIIHYTDVEEGEPSISNQIGREGNAGLPLACHAIAFAKLLASGQIPDRWCRLLCSALYVNFRWPRDPGPRRFLMLPGVSEWDTFRRLFPDGFEVPLPLWWHPRIIRLASSRLVRRWRKQLTF